MWYQKLLVILVSGIIGYITNYLAVKMIFHPLKEYKIGKVKIPFTPGIIPKNRKKLTEAIASNLIDNYLSEEIIKEKIDFDKIKNLSKDMLIKKFEDNHVEKIIVDEIIKSISGNLGFFQGMILGFKPMMEEKILEYFYNNVDKLVDNIIDEDFFSLIFKELNLKEILIKELNNLSIKEFEEMILKIMKRELRAITNLGAVLGLLLGIINVFII